MKYIRKPSFVEAMQYTGGNALDIGSWSGLDCKNRIKTTSSKDGTLAVNDRILHINRFTGQEILKASPRDWIVKSEQDVFFVLSPENFWNLYEEMKAL